MLLQEQTKLYRDQVEELLNSILKPVLKRERRYEKGQYGHLEPIIEEDCRYEIKPNGWLTVEYKAPLNYAPKDKNDYKYYLVVALNIHEKSLKKIQDILIVGLFDLLRSLKQDLNGIQNEYKLIKK
jgi:hypothetical protein